MKRLITCVLLLFATTTLSARENPLVKYLPYSHELGLRYGVQLSLGAGAAPEMQALSIDYACYGYSNIGFRTGLNLLVPTDIERGVSVPLQFSWRTGRIASAWRRARDEGESCRAYYNPWAGIRGPNRRSAGPIPGSRSARCCSRCCLRPSKSMRASLRDCFSDRSAPAVMCLSPRPMLRGASAGASPVRPMPVCG